MITYAIGYPAYRSMVNVNHALMAARLKEGTPNGPRLVMQLLADTCSIDAARNHLLWQALTYGARQRVPVELMSSFSDWEVAGDEVGPDGKKFFIIQRQPDWLLMLDADTFHLASADVCRMIELGEGMQAAVVAAPVMMRGRPGVNIERWTEDGKLEQVPYENVKDQIVPVHHIGTAFMAINLNWIKKYWPYEPEQEPWFQSKQYFEADGKMPRWTSEDYNFCDAIRKRNGLVLCDGRFTPEHFHR